MLRSKSKYANIRQYINLDLLNLVRVMCVCTPGRSTTRVYTAVYTPNSDFVTQYSSRANLALLRDEVRILIFDDPAELQLNPTWKG